MDKPKVFKLKKFADSRGKLVPVEFDRNLPFKPKRMYWVFDVKKIRGGHAHLKEKEIFICLQGSFTAKLHDGKKWMRFKLRPTQAIFTPNLVWHEFRNFSKDAILLALSGTHYSSGKKGYIMDFSKFLRNL